MNELKERMFDRVWRIGNPQYNSIQALSSINVPSFFFIILGLLFLAMKVNATFAETNQSLRSVLCPVMFIIAWKGNAKIADVPFLEQKKMKGRPAASNLLLFQQSQ